MKLIKHHVDIIESQLANNDIDTDKELVQYFVSEGVEPELAKTAIGFRNIYMFNIMPQNSINEFINGDFVEPLHRHPEFDELFPQYNVNILDNVI